jgi:enoyl-CoA hydratase
MSPDGVVLSERRGSVLIVTMNRPEARNAVTSEMANGIAAAIEELGANRSLSVAVVTGASGYFCAGMDLNAFAEGDRPWVKNGFAGITETTTRQATDRSDRGLRGGRWPGDRLGL